MLYEVVLVIFLCPVIVVYRARYFCCFYRLFYL